MSTGVWRVVMFVLIKIACGALCPVDQYSKDGFEPCTACPSGSTSPVVGLYWPVSFQESTNQHTLQGYDAVNDYVYYTVRPLSGANYQSTMQRKGYLVLSVALERATSINFCWPCQVGAYFQSALGMCLPCVAGTYNQVPGSYAPCTRCPSGTLGVTVGLKSSTAVCPTPCTGGYYGSAGASACVFCSGGSYSIGAGNSACTNCPAGTAGTRTGQTSQIMACHINCAAGSYSRVGASVCSLCENGTYVETSRASVCTNCTSGTWGAVPGQTSQAAACPGSCSVCGAGSFVAYNCSLGRDTVCSPCLAPLGSFTWETGCKFSCNAGYMLVSASVCLKIPTTTTPLVTTTTTPLITTTTTPLVTTTTTPLVTTSTTTTPLDTTTTTPLVTTTTTPLETTTITHVLTTNTTVVIYSTTPFLTLPIATTPIAPLYSTVATVSINATRAQVCSQLSVYVSGFCDGLGTANPADNFTCSAQRLDGVDCPGGVCPCISVPGRRLRQISTDLDIRAVHYGLFVAPPLAIAWMLAVRVAPTCPVSGCSEAVGSTSRSSAILYGSVGGGVVCFMLVVAVVVYCRRRARRVHVPSDGEAERLMPRIYPQESQ